ncbi:hypothetical protein L211DRAFT_779448 [Terfezia boudieri ATCC MYA-4762]|uniref:Methyltransferase type 11 domain-containing protein n=1 Tax=Terfezia boudieri ATCC MYA-4762 TaxID=1051890 RepID=A0A3N4LXN8_9PEZI|nr:hypothetical protein L211DRAFT_779448 [Terfezia boudieri ATCC MYA-4762]
MRIDDVRDLENEFAFAHTTDRTPTSPADFATTKGVKPNSNSSLPFSINTAEDVSLQPPSTLGGSSANGTVPEDLADKLDATPLCAFRQFLKSSGERDAFIQRSDRFDALQTQRICTHLRNDYQVVPVKKAKKLEEQSATSNRIIKQREVADKMLTSMWAMMSFRWMAFGRLLVSPAHELLVATCEKKSIRRDSSGTESEQDRKRILDLGGIPVGDWGWYCAYDYPKSKVYTVTPRTTCTSSASVVESDTPGQSAKCRGPKNHRYFTVSYLWRLPFPDNHFDVVSARSLFMALKTHYGKGRSPTMDLISPVNIMDEYDLCLEECLRVLKPGGYLEYFLFDNDIVNPGPLAVEISMKFTNELEANSYDPYPTRKWIKRLNKAGYGDMKRAWIFLPMAPQVKPKPQSKDGEYEVQPQIQQHQQSGSSNNNIDAVKEEVRRKLEAWEDLGTMKGSTESVAPVTGLIGSWVWERWMLKTSAEVEEGSEWNLSLDTIGSVLDEGRDMKSGWRAMMGWARKPPANNIRHGWS